jgi:hypothetical protein
VNLLDTKTLNFVSQLALEIRQELQKNSKRFRFTDFDVIINQSYFMAVTYSNANFSSRHDVPSTYREVFRTTSMLRPQFIILIQGMMTEFLYININISEEQIFDFSKKMLLYFNLLSEKGMSNKIFLLQKGATHAEVLNSISGVSDNSDLPFYLNMRFLKNFLRAFKGKLVHLWEKNDGKVEIRLEQEFYIEFYRLYSHTLTKDQLSLLEFYYYSVFDEQ